MQQYLNLLKDVRENGIYRSDRTGTGCYTVFGRQMRFNLNDDQFPIVTTKKVHLKSIVYELLWFLRGDTNTRYLKENNVKIWDDWADEYGDLGTVYSAPWRRLPLSGEDIVLIKRRNGPPPGPVSVKKPITEELESEYKGDLRVEHSNLGNPYRIIKQLGSVGRPNTEYLVQFNHTLSTRMVTRPNIRSGTRVNDCNLQTVFGVACIGSCGKFRERDYALWFNMIARCYNKKNPAYKFYGGLGVYVSPRWLCFANFLDDLSRIPNYEQWRRSARDYELDKDYYGSKCYDIDTCVFLKKNMNHELAAGEQVLATHKDGSSRLFMSKKQLSRFFNANEETLRSYQSGKHKTSKLDGWVITSVDQSSEYLVRRKIIQDQIAELIDGLRKNPFSRRHIVTGWIPEFLPDEGSSFSENINNGKQALPPCHTLFQFSATPLDYNDRLKLALSMGRNIPPQTVSDISTVTAFLDELKVPACKLSCQIYQRSADVFLGLPFNIASYALLTKMVAKVTNMVPDSLVWTGGDVHVYSNHLEQVDLQLTRTPHELPKMTIRDRNQSINDFIYEDFDLVGYLSDDSISAPVAV